MPQQELNLGELFLKVIIPKFLSFMVILAQTLLTLGIGAQVFFRYILHQDLYGAEEFILIFAFWLYMMGAAYGSFEDSHIQADIVNEYVKNEKIKLRMKLLVSFISTTVCLVINYWAYNYFVWGIVKHARSIAWRIPMVIPPEFNTPRFFHNEYLFPGSVFTRYFERPFPERVRPAKTEMA